VIGIFDSGYGGLTILDAVAQRLPGQRLLYLGDHANAPYGERGMDEIVALTRAGVEVLFAAGCSLVVIACNTASAAALRRLQREWLPLAHPQRRMLGVVVPMVEAVTGLDWMAPPADPPPPPKLASVGIFATPATVASGGYPAEIHKRTPGCRVVQQACPGLAGAIEAGEPIWALRARIVAAVAGMQRITDGHWPETVILGCTHYPLVADLFREALQTELPVLCQPSIVAEALADYVHRHPHHIKHDDESAVLLTSGDAAVVSEGASRFLGRPVVFSKLPAPNTERGDYGTGSIGG
jgi:glutamate racemase